MVAFEAIAVYYKRITIEENGTKIKFFTEKSLISEVDCAFFKNLLLDQNNHLKEPGHNPPLKATK